jgi:ESCRT-II complex subunit VPS25
MSLTEVRQIIDWMTREEGARRAEWVGRGDEKGTAWIYWKRPEEWAEAIARWVRGILKSLTHILIGNNQVDDTGQKNTVLTLYELTRGEDTSLEGRRHHTTF